MKDKADDFVENRLGKRWTIILGAKRHPL